MHIIAAKAVCLLEALKPEFKTYGEQIIKNCKALSDRLLKNGCSLVSGGSDNHLILMDLTCNNLTGKELEKRLDDVYITVNKNTIPNEPLSPFVTSGIRIGTAAVTTRGLLESDMELVADCITMAINTFDSDSDKIKNIVSDICNKYPLY